MGAALPPDWKNQLQEISNIYLSEKFRVTRNVFGKQPYTYSAVLEILCK
jgi:hypothetical protein